MSVQGQCPGIPQSVAISLSPLPGHLGNRLLIPLGKAERRKNTIMINTEIQWKAIKYESSTLWEHVGDKTEILFPKVIAKNKACDPIEKEKKNLEIILTLEW